MSFATSAVVLAIAAVAQCKLSTLAAKETDVPDSIKVSTNAFTTKGTWTREQLKLAFNFYCQTPFGKLDRRNPKIVELSGLIGRTPSALAMKLVNFASLDPSITSTGRRGLTSVSALDRSIWDEFHADWERLAVECAYLHQYLLREYKLEPTASSESSDGFALADYTGETRQAIVEQRIKQDFFRRAVLASYRGRCCISGVSDPRLLVASHIVPWRDDKANRLNPANGLCLSAIHDRAFDQHLFTLTDDQRIVLSANLKQTQDTFLREVFWTVEGKSIELPDRFAPDPALLTRHRTTTLSNRPDRT